jgi:LmbE family N-acetylglucosaminyl deacetylase
VRGKGLVRKPVLGRLYVSHERPQPHDRVLVLSPHPDDAEIASFGLYADTRATIVTLTAGNDSNRFDGANGTTIHLPREIVARMRVLDSISVPQLGGVEPDRAVNLCYPDGKLRAMRAEPTRTFDGIGSNPQDFAELRRLNRSPLVRDFAACTWSDLVNDLAQILEIERPTIIVTPHPWLDPHPDHACTTAGLCEAVQRAGVEPVRVYFYANHNRCSELWPFGPARSGMALLPMLRGHTVECEGFYSHPLTELRMHEKYLALEAMHDVRDLWNPGRATLRAHVSRIRSYAAAALEGSLVPPASYLRRAVRPDEFFLTASFATARELCKRLFPDSGSEARTARPLSVINCVAQFR